MTTSNHCEGCGAASDELCAPLTQTPDGWYCECCADDRELRLYDMAWNERRFDLATGSSFE